MRYFAMALLAYAFTVQHASAQTSPLDGFTAMSLPQSSLPIGSRWLQGTGPDGPGTAAENIDHSDSLSSVGMNKTLKKNLSFSLGVFLGLSADRAKNLDVKYTDLKVDRVGDLTKVAGLQSGHRILYDAIKAATIEINSTSGTNAALKAAAEAKGIDAVLSVGSGTTSVLKLNGSNLYIAYRIMELGQAVTTRQRADLTNSNSGFEAFAAPYRVTRLGAFAASGMCAGTWTPTPTEFAIVNEAQPDITGEFPSQKISVMPRAPAQSFPLAATRTGNTIFARRLTISYDPQGRPITLEDGRPACLLEFSGNANFIELTTSKFDLKPLQKPIGL